MGNRDREEEAGKESRGESWANKVRVPSSEQGKPNNTPNYFPQTKKKSVDHVDSITKNQFYH